MSANYKIDDFESLKLNQGHTFVFMQKVSSRKMSLQTNFADKPELYLLAHVRLLAALEMNYARYPILRSRFT